MARNPRNAQETGGTRRLGFSEKIIGYPESIFKVLGAMDVHALRNTVPMPNRCEKTRSLRRQGWRCVVGRQERTKSTF